MSSATGQTRPSRRRGGWTAGKQARLAEALAVIDELRPYWPLTLRQVYYRLVAAGSIPNNTNAYKALSRLLTQARLDELAPWEAMEDRARSAAFVQAWGGPREFVAAWTEAFLQGYRRDLLRSQAVAVEVWVEKDALSRLCQQAANPYCVPVVVARGFSSVSYLNELRGRVEANAAAGRPTELLYFGDLDPSGVAMLPAMLETLQGEMGLGERVLGARCALTPEQVAAYHLPRNPDAVKERDSRRRAYVAEFGELAVELDALAPADLIALVREAIEARLDLSQLAAERGRQEAEAADLDALRRQVCEFVAQEEV